MFVMQQFCKGSYLDMSRPNLCWLAAKGSAGHDVFCAIYGHRSGLSTALSLCLPFCSNAVASVWLYSQRWNVLQMQDGKLGGSKRREALRELVGKEEERAVLAGVRLELESLRIMCDRVSRRERLKRECELLDFA